MMNSLLDKLSFSKRIFIIILIPLAGLCIFSIVTIYDHMESANQIKQEIDSVSELTELGALIADSVHQWQKERGRSAGFIGSKGSKFSDEIRAQHKASDRAMKTLETALDAHDYANQPVEFHETLKQGVQLMATVSSLRNDVLNLRIQGSDSVSQYTNLIATFLQVIDTSAKLTSKSEISLLLVSYSNFLRAKENMGIERAIITNTLGADKFTGDFFERYCKVLANQDSYLANFNSFAHPEHFAAYRKIVSGSSVDQVAAWEKLIFEKSETGNFGISQEDWFAKISDKIDLMKRVENIISESVSHSSENIKATGEAKYYTLLGISGIIIFFTVSVSYWLASLTKTSLRNTVHQLTTGVDEVASASGEVSKASVNMANAANEQTTSLNHTNEVLENITEITRQNSQLTNNANKITTEALDMVDHSLNEMRGLQEAMDDICTSSDEISAIIKTIDEIAFQTNILALNAAVEAARAGESGAGFAVVADEVRNLAQRSAQAANDTTRKIEDSIKRANKGTKISSTVGKLLEGMVVKVRNVDQVVSQIDVSSKNQLNAIIDIQTAIKEQETIAMGASATTEETAAAAEELHGQAEGMQCSIHNLAIQAGAKPSASFSKSQTNNSAQFVNYKTKQQSQTSFQKRKGNRLSEFNNREVSELTSTFQ